MAVASKPRRQKVQNINVLDAQQVIEQMRALSHSAPYETLIGLWARERAKLMARGKTDRATETSAREAWARLEGFELAA